MLYRILVTTHHITSRAKIQRLSRAAEQLAVSVLIKKTIKPYGVMVCEGDTEQHAREWLAVVKGLRYKGYRFIKGEYLTGSRLILGGKNGARVVEGTSEFNIELDRLSAGPSNSGLKAWWAAAMRSQPA